MRSPSPPHLHPILTTSPPHPHPTNSPYLIPVIASSLSVDGCWVVFNLCYTKHRDVLPSKECWRLAGCHEVYPSRQRRRLKTVDTQVANSWLKSFLFLRDWMWCRQIVRKISAVWGKIDLLLPSPLPTIHPHPHPLIYVYNLLSRWRHFAVWLAGRKARVGHEKHNITRFTQANRWEKSHELLMDAQINQGALHHGSQNCVGLNPLLMSSQM